MSSTVAEPGPAAGADEVPAPVRLLVDFAQALREEGLPVGSGDVLTYTRAMAVLRLSDVEDLYWGGRTTLVTRRDQIPVYDAVFRRFFLHEADRRPEPERTVLRAAARVVAELTVPQTEPGDEEQEGEQTPMGHVAANAEILRRKAFALCTPDELLAVRRMISAIRLAPPRRRSRRTASDRSGRRPDVRRTVREALRRQGEVGELRRLRHRRRTRRLVLVLDVSGSMSDYSRNLLHFAYSTRRATTRVEVFCFGTRLTRITRSLDRRRPDDALSRAADAVFDWEGGTRIGDSLRTFVRDHARRGVCRGGVVVICSDGLDRGDPAVLADAMERLSRLCRTVVWLNPHKGDAVDFVPSTMGMMVAAPYVDLLLSGHDLRSLEDFAGVLPTL